MLKFQSATIFMEDGQKVEWEERWKFGPTDSSRTYIWSTFDLAVCKVILESLDSLVLKWPLTQRRLAVEQK